MPDRETLDVDVLIVGAGPAGLSAAYHLQTLVRRHAERVDKGEAPGPKLDGLSVMCIEKAGEVGAHMISGAILEPTALQEMMPDYRERGAPIEGDVKDEEIYYLTEELRLRLPFVPPGMRNHGNHIISLNSFIRWFGKQVEERGGENFTLMPGFPAQEPLIENDRVVGVRTGDKGIDKHGQRKSNYEPGVDIRAKLTIFAEGSRGSVTKVLVSRFGLDRDRNPQIYSTGVKEVWEIPESQWREGVVLHTMGWPLGSRAVGGSFLYFMKDRKVSVGLVVSLDSEDPFLDPHREFQRLKTHPLIASILKGGSVVSYGAKTIPEGGFFSLFQPYFPGGLLIGDGAGLMNMRKLKGVHLAMKSGMFAAETVFEALRKNSFTTAELSRYEDLYRSSWMYDELWEVRNFRQALGQGLFWGGIHMLAQQLTGGRGFTARMPTEPGHERMKKLRAYYGDIHRFGDLRPPKKVEGDLTFDKVTDVFHSGTVHEEDQVAHLHVSDLNICATKCREEYGNPCQYFCPANVYEMVVDEARGKEAWKLQLNFSNCVHCKTCDIADPYQIVTWVPPEGGGGPNYKLL
ncbi:MAG: electron transfer flavoprotein-ubiquinone oxidoreductase [Planctomycetes bacterium]|nr:electron transfer flavoprotein-ubiquinone oxidoreductase [Planctomycetota bacterium]